MAENKNVNRYETVPQAPADAAGVRKEFYKLYNYIKKYFDTGKVKDHLNQNQPKDRAIVCDYLKKGKLCGCLYGFYGARECYLSIEMTEGLFDISKFDLSRFFKPQNRKAEERKNQKYTYKLRFLNFDFVRDDIEKIVIYILEQLEKTELSASPKDKVATRKEAVKQAEQIDELHLEGLDKEAVIKVRVNQGKFREMMLKKYDKCCLCNVRESALLIASHIKPWSDSTLDERIDEDNGFLLCPNHDKLFDGGWISFDDDGKILINDKLDANNCKSMNARSDMKIPLSEGNKKYLAYHRDKVFR